MVVIFGMNEDGNGFIEKEIAFRFERAPFGIVNIDGVRLEPSVILHVWFAMLFVQSSKLRDELLRIVIPRDDDRVSVGGDELEFLGCGFVFEGVDASAGVEAWHISRDDVLFVPAFLMIGLPNSVLEVLLNGR